jgi:hypothetical protein
LHLILLVRILINFYCKINPLNNHTRFKIRCNPLSISFSNNVATLSTTSRCRYCDFLIFCCISKDYIVVDLNVLLILMETISFVSVSTFVLGVATILALAVETTSISSSTLLDKSRRLLQDAAGQNNNNKTKALLSP